MKEDEDKFSFSVGVEIMFTVTRIFLLASCLFSSLFIFLLFIVKGQHDFPLIFSLPCYIKSEFRQVNAYNNFHHHSHHSHHFPSHLFFLCHLILQTIQQNFHSQSNSIIMINSVTLYYLIKFYILFVFSSFIIFCFVFFSIFSSLYFLHCI